MINNSYSKATNIYSDFLFFYKVIIKYISTFKVVYLIFVLGTGPAYLSADPWYQLLKHRQAGREECFSWRKRSALAGGGRGYFFFYLNYMTNCHSNTM